MKDADTVRSNKVHYEWFNVTKHSTISKVPGKNVLLTTNIYHHDDKKTSRYHHHNYEGNPDHLQHIHLDSSTGDFTIISNIQPGK